jgi:light-regulated signal transduction histidine kinase (bacteriophytochrome)
VLGGEVAGVALRLAVDDEVDVALAEQDDVLRAVLRDEREAELLEHRLERSRLGRRELDELEAHQAHRVLEQISHAVLLRSRARRRAQPTRSR